MRRPFFSGDCATLAASGVDKIMNMRTYNGISYEEWYYTELAPALAVGRQDVVGHGLGCYVDGCAAITAPGRPADCLLPHRSTAPRRTPGP